MKSFAVPARNSASRRWASRTGDARSSPRRRFGPDVSRVPVSGRSLLRRRDRARSVEFGARLAREGVVGRFAIGFVAVRDQRMEGLCD